MKEQQLQEVYQMVDQLNLSRPKKNINRDFADGMLMAEVIHHYNPRLVSVHNYPASNSLSKKIANWDILNTKVFKKIGINLTKQHIQDIASATPYAIEQLLYQVLVRFDKPDQEATLSQNARKFEANQPIEPNNTRGQTDIDMRRKQKLMISLEESPSKARVQQSGIEEVQELLQKIQQANSQLFKLVQLNKAKEDMILNLERKLQKMLIGV